MVESILSYNSTEEDDYYALLGCSEISTVEQINTEYKLKALKEHPDKNMNDETSGENFKRLQLAKEVLTDPVRRADYDKWRHSGLAISYKQWKSLGESARTTMHWASKPQTKPMLEPGPSEANESHTGKERDSTSYTVGNTVWHRKHGNDMLSKFRNYEI